MRLGPGEELGHVFKGAGDIVARVGVGEAEVALAVLAESGACEAGDSGLFEQQVGEGVCAVAGIRDAWEGVEGAFGDDAIDARELVEAGDDQVPAGAELGEHSVYAVLRAGEGLETGVLGGGVGAGVRVDLKLSYLFCEGLW